MISDDRRGDRRQLLLLGGLVVLAFALRLAWIAAVRFTPSLSDDAGRYDFLGRSLAAGGGFVNPNGTTTMFWPPGYPFILAAIYKLYPHWLLADHTVRAALLVNALLGAAAVALVYAIGVRAFDRRTALLGALLTALFPSLIFFSNITLSETAFTFLLLAALALLIEAEARGRLLLLAAAGAIIGYAALVRGQAALLPLVALPFWWRSVAVQLDAAPPATIARRLALRLAIVGVPAAIVIAPWLARNVVESKSLVFISSNAGVDFYIGHSAGANGGGRKVDELVFRYPDRPQAEAEAQISRDGFREGLSYAVHHPAREVTLSARKLVRLYATDGEAVRWTDGHGEHRVMAPGVRHALITLSNAWYWSMLLLALAGAAAWLSVRHPVRLLLVCLVAYWTLVHIAFFGDPRFHAPVMPVLALWAAAGVWWGGDRWRNRAALAYSTTPAPPTA